MAAVWPASFPPLPAVRAQGDHVCPGPSASLLAGEGCWPRWAGSSNAGRVRCGCERGAAAGGPGSGFSLLGWPRTASAVKAI